MGEKWGKKFIEEILDSVGIKINGSNPWDLKVKHDGFYWRVLSDGSIGFGEAYMDGWWECENLDDFFCRLMPSNPQEKVQKNLKTALYFLGAVMRNLASKSRAFQIGEKHYDVGNELYRKMLDKRMVYSCAYWKDTCNLDDAQEAKLDLICRKLGLQAGQQILDIGCGWGSLVRYAAEKYGVSAVGITVSREQAALAKELCEGFPVEIRLEDYRDTTGIFDHIVSVGMFEHVGYKNYRTYMEVASRLLSDDGFFLLHTIGNNVTSVATDPWFGKYIFPNSVVPSLKQISQSTEGVFVLEDLHNFGPYYDTTLSSWFHNFDMNWDSLKHHYDDRFYRMWKYYLLSCAGSFRSRVLQVWQMVLSKNGTPGGYEAVR